MEPKIILLLTAEHTGSTFCMELLAAHESISEPNIVPPYVTLQTMQGDEILETAPCEYALIKSHLYMSCFLPTVFIEPRPFKMVSTVRHPYRVLRSTCIHNHHRAPHEIMDLDTIVLRYLHMLDTIAKYGEAFVLPIDLMGQQPVAQRIEQIERLFCDFLGLPLTEAVLEKTETWTPVGIAPPGDLTEKEHEEIMQILQDVPLIDELKKIGVDYS